MKIKKSIKSKLILGILISFLVPYSLAGIYLKTTTEEWLFEENLKENQVLLKQTAERVDESVLIRMKDLMEMISMNEDIKNVNPDVRHYLTLDDQIQNSEIVENEKRIIEFFKSIKETHDVIAFISYGTENGSYIEYPEFNPTKAYDPRKREWYINALKKEESFLSEPYLTQVSKDTVFSIDKAVKKDNEIMGVLSLTIKLDTLVEKINSINYSDSGYINILSPKNVFINNPKNPNWHLKSIEELGLEIFKNIDAYDGGSYEGELDNERKVFNVYISPHNGWKYISVINRSEVLGQSRELMNLLILTYFVLLGILISLALIIANNITKPIRLISKHMHYISKFKFNKKKDQALQKYLKSKDEIGEITNVLFEMKDNFIELEKNIEKMDYEIKNIDVNSDDVYKLELSKNNPFESVTHSINDLLTRVYDYISQIQKYNIKIKEKNDLLKLSEEKLIGKIKEIDKQNEYISFIAEHDNLTGLPNRRVFNEKLKNAISNSYSISILLIDLDNFKSINDSHGHVFGDKVLKHIGEKLNEISNDAVFISRFGGDEFLILFNNNLAEITLKTFVNQIFNLFKDDFIIGEVLVNVNLSIGITQSPKDSQDIEQLIMNADMALYEVKANGKNNFAFFSKHINAKLKNKVKIIKILENALSNDGFKMVYQPQIDINTGKVEAFEALLRLKEYNISPGEFIPIAEDNGLMMKIGRKITEAVVQDMAGWVKDGYELKPVSINYSVVQMLDHNYNEFLINTLNKYSIDPSLICIEITENIFIENKQETISFINSLKTKGIKIAIDDFGTGFSSLSYLTYLPLDIVKLDRSLCVKFLELDNLAIMDSLIDLIHSLKLKVVAEGIENRTQVARLKKGKCDMIQGYYYDKPLEKNQAKNKIQHIYKS